MSSSWRHWFVPHTSNRFRARFLHPDGLFLVGILIIVLHVGLGFLIRRGILSSVLGYSSDITQAKVLSATNEQRVQAGLKPLTVNSKLTAAAQAKANDMLAHQYWSHTSPTGKSPWSFVKGSGYSYGVAGENLARNFADTPGMVNAWLGSATHRENLLSNKYTETGIAVLNGTLQGVETTLVVQMFATPKKAPVAEIPPSPVAAPAPEVGKAPLPEEIPKPEVPEEILTTQADETANAPVLGDQSSFSLPELTPHMITRFLLSIVVAFLIALLAHDSLEAKGKKRRLYGKNLAHIFLLFAVATTLFVMEKTGVLL